MSLYRSIVHIRTTPVIDCNPAKPKFSGKLVTANTPLLPISEAFRVLRTNIQFSFVDNPPKSISITSPGPSEGKSIILANLAVVMAQSVKAAKIIAYEDLGTEAIRELKVKNLPCIVANDIYGKDLYEEGVRQNRK